MNFKVDKWENVKKGTLVKDWIMCEKDFWFKHNGHDFAYISNYEGREVFIFQNKENLDFIVLDFEDMRLHRQGLFKSYETYKVLLRK